MKIILLVLTLFCLKLNAQVVSLPENTTLHFISPEPIQYVDISSKNIVGDLPLKNVLCIRLKDSCKATDAIVTIVGEKYIAHYHLVPGGTNVPTEINILPADTRPLDISGIEFSQNQLKVMALRLFSKRPDKRIEHAAAFNLNASVNHLYTAGDYIFLDLTYKNSTNLKYDIDQLRFKVDDKKVTKATNVQSVEIDPVYTLFDVSSFKKHYRNIFVFKKITFPGNKVLQVELSEKQFSGRIISLAISWKDILEADTIPLQ